MSDVAFRWIFTKESNNALLRDFLNELITDREITAVELYKDSQMPVLFHIQHSETGE